MENKRWLVQFLSFKFIKRIFTTKSLITGCQVLIGCAILAWLLLYFIDNNVLSNLSKANPWLFMFSILCWIFMGLAMASRLRYLLESSFYRRISLFKAFFSNQIGMLLSDITPARSGYFGAIYYLKKDSELAYDKLFGMLLGIQLFDFLCKIFFSVLAVSYLLIIINVSEKIEASITIGLLLFSITVAIGFILIWYNKIVYFNRFIIRLPKGKAVIEKISQTVEGLNKIKPNYLYVISVSFAGSLFVSLQWWFIGNSIGLNIPLICYILLPSLVSIAAFAPVGVAGLGLQEASITIILTCFGVPTDMALLFSLLVRASNVIADTTGLFKIVEGKNFFNVKRAIQ